MHDAGSRGGRRHRVGLLIVVLALMAPAMNLAMGAKATIGFRPLTAVTVMSTPEAAADASGSSAERPAGPPVVLIQKARGVLTPNVVFTDATVMPPGTASGRPSLVWRSVAVPLSPQAIGQPRRGPPPMGVFSPHHRRPHGPF